MPRGTGSGRGQGARARRKDGDAQRDDYAGQLFAGKRTNEFLLLRQGVADFAWGSTIPFVLAVLAMIGALAVVIFLPGLSTALPILWKLYLPGS